MGSYTKSASTSRFGMLKFQVLTLISDTVGLSNNARNSISIGLEKHYIEDVLITGLFSPTEIGAQMRLHIDWREHSISVAAGGDKIQIPSHWKNNIAPSIQEACIFFNEECNKANLIKEWSVVYSSIYNREVVNRELGFHPAPKRKWRYSPQSKTWGLGPLTEANLTVSLGID